MCAVERPTMTSRPLLAVAFVALALGAGCYGSGGGSGDDDSSGGSSSSGAASGSGGSSSGKGGSTSSGSGGSGSGGSTSGSGGSIFSGSGGSGGGNTGSGGTAGSGGTYQCTGDGSEFETFDKSCTTVDDCVMATHMTSCCGDSTRVGINESELQRYSTVETFCAAQFPVCGCAAQGVSAEDGTLVQYGSEDQIVLECADGQCTTRYAGPTFQCVDHLCTDEQICAISIGGPAGSEPYGYCNPNNGCTSCDCVSSVGCTCAEVSGHLTVTCAAP